MVNFADAADDELANVVGEQGRAVLLESANAEDGLRVYVNYALGTEANAVVYGHRDEEWRLRKLQSVKRRYDAKGMFDAYLPVGR